jgi:hypothetical protein
MVTYRIRSVLVRNVILQCEVAVTTPFLVVGVVAVAAGVALHAWTAKLLGIKATFSYTELSQKLGRMLS